MSAAVVDTAVIGSATPHPATVSFARRLQAVAQSNQVRMLDTCEIHRLDELRLSQTRFYRYCYGQYPPGLDRALALAHLFGVPPGHFVSELTDQSPDLN